MSSSKVTTILPPPPTPHTSDPRAVLSENEQRMYNEVLGHFTKEGEVYVLPNVEKGELEENEKFWLSRECILRYLRASKWKVATAITRLESTLKWRREFGIETVVTGAHVEPEAVTGKEILFGFDVKGRPAFYMIPSRQNTDGPERQIQFAFWMIERCIDLMEPGVENMDLLINYADKAKSPALGVARTVVSILQDHYPERLGNALILNVPFILNAFYKMISPFIDPITREKMKFNPNVVQDELFAPDQVMKEWWGGDADFEYVHADYWPSILKLSAERKAGWRAAWRKLGAKVGISEWEYKTKSVASAVQVGGDALEPEEKKVEVITTEVEVPVVAKDIKSENAGNAQGVSTATSASGHETSTAAVAGAGAVTGAEAGAGSAAADSCAGDGADGGAE